MGRDERCGRQRDEKEKSEVKTRTLKSEGCGTRQPGTRSKSKSPPFQTKGGAPRFVLRRWPGPPAWHRRLAWQRLSLF
jgi:hypothetical protein